MKINYNALRSTMVTFQSEPMNPNVEDVIDKTIAEGFTREDVTYAVKQAIDSGLLQGNIMSTLSGSLFFTVSDITPQGHQFIDAITEDTHWNRVKSFLKEEGLPLTVGTISKAIAKIFF
ncbi:DUF2513 domain-containing protein [Levilactobacillus angrenensis]|uniref:DUF2513 domain-containing protein n=1 Tax=Levilactobacillus angrenensis TaxID=2486020 RepID=A0ABW1UB32_9LACO|nr:DUF2513 domain-containing protein [Levilactobacillus angrenensis]